MVPEQNYEETDRLEMLLLRQDVLSDFLLDTWKADFKTSSKWRAIPNVDPHSLAAFLVLENVLKTLPVGE